MAVTYGFYNSQNHDRLYDAVQLSSIFDGIINDGVYMSIGGKLMVNADTGMSINVATGRAWFNHTWTLNDAVLPLTIDAADVVLSRIDAVVIEIDSTTRTNTIKVVKGTSSSNPVAPTLTKTDDIHQYPLALVSIGANVSAITASNITNKVGTSDCPWVTGIIETINTDELVSQWQSQFTNLMNQNEAEFEAWASGFESSKETEFNAWFDSIKGMLGDDPATALAARMEEVEKRAGTNSEQIVDGLINVDSTSLIVSVAYGESYSFIDGAMPAALFAVPPGMTVTVVISMEMTYNAQFIYYDSDSQDYVATQLIGSVISGSNEARYQAINASSLPAVFMLQTTSYNGLGAYVDRVLYAFTNETETSLSGGSISSVFEVQLIGQYTRYTNTVILDKFSDDALTLVVEANVMMPLAGSSYETEESIGFVSLKSTNIVEENSGTTNILDNQYIKSMPL